MSIAPSASVNLGLFLDDETLGESSSLALVSQIFLATVQDSCECASQLESSFLPILEEIQIGWFNHSGFDELPPITIYVQLTP